MAKLAISRAVFHSSASVAYLESKVLDLHAVATSTFVGLLAFFTVHFPVNSLAFHGTVKGD